MAEVQVFKASSFFHVGYFDRDPRWAKDASVNDYFRKISVMTRKRKWCKFEPEGFLKNAINESSCVYGRKSEEDVEHVILSSSSHLSAHLQASWSVHPVKLCLRVNRSVINYYWRRRNVLKGLQRFLQTFQANLEKYSLNFIGMKKHLIHLNGSHEITNLQFDKMVFSETQQQTCVGATLGHMTLGHMRVGSDLLVSPPWRPLLTSDAGGQKTWPSAA